MDSPRSRPEPSPAETLTELVALCHDAAALGSSVAPIVEEADVSEFCLASVASYRVTIDQLEELLTGYRQGAVKPEGTVSGAADRLLALISAAVSDEKDQVLRDAYIEALDRVLTKLRVACERAELPAGTRDFLLPRMAAHELHHEHFKANYRRAA